MIDVLVRNTDPEDERKLLLAQFITDLRKAMILDRR